MLGQLDRVLANIVVKRKNDPLANGGNAPLPKQLHPTATFHESNASNFGLFNENNSTAEGVCIERTDLKLWKQTSTHPLKVGIDCLSVESLTYL